MTTVVVFLTGVLAMGFGVVATFFFRFWRESHDRLFAFFAFGFTLLGIERALLTWVQPVEILYVLRLIAFLLIAAAIIEKNRSRA